ncbi:hypothetical protein GGI05_004753 [Coemansia sp. RSA 2603]|nr:hypothetical protein GGI05_004753 [Coemansia sp. RSA 2603]
MSFFGDHVTGSIEELLTRHARGLETTIYADAEALEILSSSTVDGLIGVLQGPGGRLRARNARLLGDYTEETLTVDDGPHVLVLLSGVSWMSRNTWSAVTRAVGRPTAKRCTLCIAQPEHLWSESAKLAATDDGGLRQPTTRTSVHQALTKAASSDTDCTVEICGPIAFTSLGGGFALPLGGTVLHGMFAPCGEWVEAERVALGLAALVHGMGLDARFYSLGASTARRVARRCARLPHSEGKRATVVVLDRLADLAALARHPAHPLDCITRAAEASGAPLDTLLTRLRMADADRLARLSDARAVRAVGESEQLAQLWGEAEGVAERLRWMDVRAAEKTLALVLACEDDADAAWDRVLEAIPDTSSDMVSLPSESETASAAQVQHMLLVCTPAPLMLVMAAAILAQRKLGFPLAMRDVAVRRLATDYQRIAGESAAAEAQQWASWFVERLTLLASGKEQFDFAVPCELGVPYAPLLPRIVEEVLSGARVSVELELADHIAAASAGSLLKGLG